MSGARLSLVLLLACAALPGGRAQVTVTEGKPSGTYDPCQQPPTNVSRVSSRQAALSA